MANRWGNSGNSGWLYFWGLQNHCRWWLQPWNEKMLAPGRKVMTNLDSILKSRDITSSTKVHLVKANGFSSGHVWMWELDHKKGWVLKNWCFWAVVLEKPLDSPLDSKEIKPVNPKGNQSGIFVGRTNAEGEAPKLWPLDMKSTLVGKELTHWKRLWCWERLKAGGEAGDRGWDGWMASLTRWTWVWANSGRGWRTVEPGCCGSWGCKDSDTTEWLDNNNGVSLDHRAWNASGRAEREWDLLDGQGCHWAHSWPTQKRPTDRLNYISAVKSGPIM